MTLADAIINHDFSKVQTLISREEFINQIDEYGFTPLIESIVMNDIKIATYLLQNGANPKLHDLTGRSPLHWAVDSNIEMCRLLLEYNADPNVYSASSQPALVFPLLRKQKDIKKLLLQYGGDIAFARNYINAKLLGHRFELPGRIHITTPNDKFIVISFEGFFLEFSLNVIKNSLERFKNNYKAKHLKHYFDKFESINNAIHNAAILSNLQHYTTKIEEHEDTINSIFNKEILLIPAVYQGHAITFIRYKNIFVKIDRGANSKFEGSIVVYKITQPHNLNDIFYKNIVYKKQTDEFMHSKINQILGLEKLYLLPIQSQVVGNCSWANVEAAVPSLLYILLYYQDGDNSIDSCINEAMALYQEWHNWDQDRALDEFTQQFSSSSDAQKASIAAILSAILFKLAENDNELNRSRAQKILRTLSDRKYTYNIESYIKTFYEKHHIKTGEILMSYLNQFRHV